MIIIEERKRKLRNVTQIGEIYWSNTILQDNVSAVDAYFPNSDFRLVADVPLISLYRGSSVVSRVLCIKYHEMLCTIRDF